MWKAAPQERGETILFFDRQSGALVGYVSWRFRREAVLDDESKRWSVEIHFMGIAAGYQHTPSDQGCSVATVMFETALNASNEAMAKRTGKKRAKGPMPTLIDAEVGNEWALGVYKHRWGFQHRRFRSSETGRVYEELWRPPPEAADSGSGESASPGPMVA